MLRGKGPPCQASLIPWLAHPRPPPWWLTPELLVSQPLLVGQQEGKQPIQVRSGTPGHDVKEDWSVEDFKDGGWLWRRSFGTLRLLPGDGGRQGDGRAHPPPTPPSLA